MSPTRQFIQQVMRDLAARYTKNGMRVLDIGTAGNLKGENDKWFGDISGTYITLDKLKEYNPDIIYDITEDYKKTMKEWPLHHGTYDIVICSQVIEHVDPAKTVQALKNIYDFLKHGGILILDSPGRAVEYHPEPGFDHYGWYTATGLGRLLQASGFKIIGEETKMNDLLSLVVGRKE